MSTATKGRRHEHAIRKILREAGYSVSRGAGSKGEFFGRKSDLIATRQTDMGNEYLVEVWGFQMKVRKK